MTNGINDAPKPSEAIQIPPAALEAGARAICETENGPCDVTPGECGCTYWTAHARAAFVAMVGAWSGSEHQTSNEWSNKEHLILPLTENPDD